MSTILVTGGSGFIAGHVILQALAAGHEVHTTVRRPHREAQVRATLESAGCAATDRLQFFVADLEHDEGWANAARDCEYVIHVASPLPAGAPAHEDELIIPARDGGRRVLRAARNAQSKRVVLTSSFAAIGYGHKPRAAPFDETSWTDLTAPRLTAYVKSKTLAERAAWEFIGREGGGLELASVNPVGVFGPVLGPDYSASIQLIQSMLEGRVPGWPRLYFGVVDVRDVADLHLRAMTHPAANGERFLAVAGDFIAMRDIARILKSASGSIGRNVSTVQLPDWMIRLAALFKAEARLALPELGKHKNATNAKARRVLGWAPRSNEECILATAESLAALNPVGAARSR
jgi:nucleoside-diphosphate-sugar epimerase